MTHSPPKPLIDRWFTLVSGPTKSCNRWEMQALAWLSMPTLAESVSNRVSFTCISSPSEFVVSICKGSSNTVLLTISLAQGWLCRLFGLVCFEERFTYCFRMVFFLFAVVNFSWFFLYFLLVFDWHFFRRWLHQTSPQWPHVPLQQ